MKVSIIGSGYVGLVTGACLADVGNQVLCLDSDPQKIQNLKKGIVPIHEPGLQEIIERCIRSGNMTFTTDARQSALHGDVHFIAVGTPPDEDGSADLSHVLAAAKALGQNLEHRAVVVGKSTVPVGTCAQIEKVVNDELKKRGMDFKIDVVSNPEFLKEGAAIADFARPDRIIVGVTNSSTLDVVRELYAPFSKNHDKLIVMDRPSAELTKYAANAMLATRISFMNEISLLAESLGADIDSVRLGIGSDPRIGYDFLYAGCGYGGSCFPKDVKALAHTSKKVGANSTMLDAVEKVNENQKTVLVKKTQGRFGKNLEGRTFAIWGLSFKPNTDDMREAASLTVIKGLLSSGAKLHLNDPIAMKNAKSILKDSNNIRFFDDKYEACSGADALLIVTEWKEYFNPDFTKLSHLKSRVIFDGRNILNKSQVSKAGFEYHGIGRLGETLNAK